MDPFDAIDPGEDFEQYAVAMERVTVRSVDPDTPSTVLATAEDVPAEGLLITSETVSARTGEVGVTKSTVWLRCDRLGFTLKPRDQIETAAGVVWLIDEAEMCGIRGTNYLARCQVTLSRSH
jgi:hypothetical protein